MRSKVGDGILSFETEFTDLMPHSIVRKAFTGRNSYGKPAYSTSGSTYTARVVNKQKLVRNASGIEQVSTVTAYVASTSAFDPEDKITLPDGTSPNIITINITPDDGGTHHSTIYFG